MQELNVLILFSAIQSSAYLLKSYVIYSLVRSRYGIQIPLCNKLYFVGFNNSDLLI